MAIIIVAASDARVNDSVLEYGRSDEILFLSCAVSLLLK